MSSVNKMKKLYSLKTSIKWQKKLKYAKFITKQYFKLAEILKLTENVEK